MNDGLVNKLVSHRFPGYGKEAWTGRVIDGPDEQDRYEIAWDLEDVYTKHKGSAVMKWLVEPSSKKAAAKLNNKPHKTANKHSLSANHQRTSKLSAVASLKRRRGGANRMEAAGNMSRIRSGIKSAEFVITSKCTMSTSVDTTEAVADTTATSRDFGTAEGAATKPLEVGSEKAANPEGERDCHNELQQQSVAHMQGETGGFDESPLAAQAVYEDTGDFGELPLATDPLYVDPGGFDVSPFADQTLYGDIGGLDEVPFAAQTLDGEAGGFHESSCVVQTTGGERSSLDEATLAAHMLHGETKSHDAAAANTMAGRKQGFSRATTAYPFQEMTAPPTKRAKQECAEEPAYTASKETTRPRNAASHAVCSTPDLNVRADWCTFCERTTLTDAKGPPGHRLLCKADETQEANLDCADYESIPSDAWYPPRCADEKGEVAAQDWAEEESSLVKQRASPRRAAAINSRVKALVKHLQESFFAAICGSLPHDDVAATQLLMSDWFAYQLYAKAIFWAGADGITSPYPSRCVVNRVSTDVAALIERSKFPNELPCNGNVAFIAQAIAMRWLEECERTAGRPLTATEPDVGEPEPLKTMVAHSERQDVPLPSNDRLVPYPTKSAVAPPLVGVMELAPANDAFSAVRVRQDVFGSLGERFNAWLDSKELGLFKILDEDDNNLHHARRDAAASASTASVPQKKSGILQRNRDDARQQRSNERKLRRHGELVRRVYVMLLRHDSLVRGDPGQHVMIPDTVMTLLRTWGCHGECFATPFNARLPAFCSPFADCDTCFGSLGNFFDSWPWEGCFEANPPFFINNDAIVDHLAELLRRAQTGYKPLSFALIHTEEHHNVCRQHSVFHSFIRAELLLEKDRHYYQEGAFFCRAQPRAYLPRFRSYVVFAATLEGTRKWPVTPDLLNCIERAFAWPPKQAWTKLNPAEEPPATCSL